MGARELGRIGSASSPILFVDSSGWIAVNDPRDSLHKKAISFYRNLALKAHPRLITTNLVIAETHAALLRAGGREQALKFLTLLEESSRVGVIHSNPELEAEALGIIIRFDDQNLSYCDAVSFAAMEKLGVRNAFAFDSNFETAGFRRLPG